MHALLCQLSGQTIRHLRGNRQVSQVAARGGVSIATWQRWELGQQIPKKLQTVNILRGLGCTDQQFEMAFLEKARLHLEQHQFERLERTAVGCPEFGELVSTFETSMKLQQATFGRLASLADGLDRLDERSEKLDGTT